MTGQVVEVDIPTLKVLTLGDPVHCVSPAGLYLDLLLTFPDGMGLSHLNQMQVVS